MQHAHHPSQCPERVLAPCPAPGRPNSHTVGLVRVSGSALHLSPAQPLQELVDEHTVWLSLETERKSPWSCCPLSLLVPAPRLGETCAVMSTGSVHSTGGPDITDYHHEHNLLPCITDHSLTLGTLQPDTLDKMTARRSPATPRRTCVQGSTQLPKATDSASGVALPTDRKPAGPRRAWP